jgi:hypothetical protein
MAIIVGGTNDGWCKSGLGSWSSSRNHAGDSFDSNNSIDVAAVACYYFARRGNYYQIRAFFEFSTSGISVAPSAATLKISGTGSNTADVIVVRSEQGGTLAAGDFNSLPAAAVTALGNSDGSGAGTFAGISGLTYSAEIATWSTSGYNDIALNATARADMASLSLFKVCLMEYDYDYLDIAGGSPSNRTGLRWAENGDTKWPYIDYTAAVTVTDNATFFGANF